MSASEIDLDKELQTIIESKTFKRDDTKTWTELLTLIPQRIAFIITKDYAKELTAEFKDPLNSSQSNTLESFANRVAQYLRTTFPEHPPFTIVRIAELLQSPKLFNSTPEKFLRALENVLQVSSSVADFPEPTFEITTNEDVKQNGRDDMVPITLGSDDSQTIFLKKIDWLTEDDIREIESEHYLVEEYPIDEAPALEDYDEDEHPIDNDQKKRNLEGSTDSPEKKHKAHIEGENDEESGESKHIEQVDDDNTETPIDDKQEDTSTIGDDTLDENKTLGDITLGDTSVADTTIGNETLDEDKIGNETLRVEEDENKNIEKEEKKESTEENELENKEESASAIGNETLDEDKMDMNTTLEEDRMDID